MSAVKDPRKRRIARIHIARQQLGMDEEDYRKMLQQVTGKDSCGQMRLFELIKVESHLKTLGWKPRPKQAGKRMSPPSKGRPVDKLRALWIEMASNGLLRDGSENALEAWVRRQTRIINGGQGIDKVDWLENDPALCTQVLESLKKWRRRGQKVK
ncbi:regulatory protein GemA [Kistimonas scapharcae]|uniref:Regulatory protein GemA n=1 Tax=Kistimonas scapharcae TaxID=1036133 RepID=A0ABP8V4U5_9GAMM